VEIQPIGNRITVEPYYPDKKESQIIQIEESEPTTKFGTVVAIGTDPKITVKPGDIVYHNEHACVWKNKDLKILNYFDVIGVIS